MEEPTADLSIAPVGVECEQQSRGEAWGWRAYLGDDDSVVIFCPRCAAREFDCA